MFKAKQKKNLVNFKSWKMRTVKKTQKSFNANIFFRIHFENKTKKWNSIFTIIYIPCKF